jgi:hypothetical protein
MMFAWIAVAAVVVILLIALVEILLEELDR